MAISLGKLGYAVGANANDTTTTSLAATGRGSTGTATALSDFTVTFTTTLNPHVVTVGLGLSETWNLVTSGTVGALFMSRIGNQTRNATWSDSLGALTWTNNAVNGTGQNNSAWGDYATIQCIWNDHLNAAVTATDTNVYITN